MMGDDITLTVAPRYYDFQVVGDYHPSERNNLRLFFYGTDDQWVMNWDDNGDDPFWGSGLNTHLMTYQGQAEWRCKLSDALSNQFSLGFGYWGGHYDEGKMRQDWNIYPMLIREELTFDPGKVFILRLGTDSELRWAKVKMKVPTDFGLEGEEGYWTGANDEWLTFEGTRFLASSGLYAELELVAIPKTQIIYGIRGDYDSAIKRWAADPRVVVRYELFPKTTLKAGLGLFHQQPGLEVSDKVYGNPNLEFTEAVHYSVGVEQQLLENLEVGVEGFYKDLRNVVRSSDEMMERNGKMVPERYNNDGIGRVYGMEVELDHHPTQRLFARISYTLMRSERKDEAGESWRLFDYDQTHILTALGTVTVGWGIDIGLKFRLVSGSPYTPVLGSSYDADSDLYVPIYGKINSRRMPLFHQLDIRIDKKWQWRYLSLTTYLDVQNVYYHKAVEDYAYSYDYAQRAAVEGLPIIPSLGLKVEY
jgi:outer membrane receptor protein involved in Fe transport